MVPQLAQLPPVNIAQLGESRWAISGTSLPAGREPVVVNWKPAPEVVWDPAKELAWGPGEGVVEPVVGCCELVEGVQCAHGGIPHRAPLF